MREASRQAHDEGAIGDYYGLDDHAGHILQSLLVQTKWRQPRASKEAGHSVLYGFHQALKRYVPKVSALSKGKRERAEALLERARRYWEKAGNTRRGAYLHSGPFDPKTVRRELRYSVNRVQKALARAREARASYEVAADLFEEIGDTFMARIIRNNNDRGVAIDIHDLKSLLDRIHRGLEKSDYVRPLPPRPRPRSLRDRKRTR